MASATMILLATTLVFNRRLNLNAPRRWLFSGFVSGFLLYGLFFVGYQFTRNLETFFGGVSSIYLLKTGIDTYLIAFLLIFPIAPAEEIYWRGLIQKHFMQFFSPAMSLILSTVAYTLIHAFTLNPPLLVTALIGGLVWGYLYNASKSLSPGIISHVIFDLLVFVVVPFT
ncbi:MAG: CPBP family intramembrane metalloprotease [Thaumarchaeota archaeon]|nr:CPBP family intramembrane metalloprotease [Nitrososphaerota archaeon]